MAAKKKPTTAVGKYGLAIKVEHVDPKEPSLSGVYTVQLGTEFKQPNSNQRRRWIKVNGEQLDIYAMVHNTSGHVVDRKILRDPIELAKRAVETYAGTTLLRDLKEERVKAARKRYQAGLISPETWVFEEDQYHMCIAPIGLEFHISPDNTIASSRKRRILKRIIQLVQEHGLG
jgi:hypothetical protein